MKLVERAKNMILTPKSEWDVVNQEATTNAGLYKDYIVYLAAIGPIASFLGMSFVGISFLGTRPIVDGLTAAIVSYVLALVGVFLIALLINVLAPTFGGQKNQVQALKVAAYSYTPAWVASVLGIVPMLGILILVAALYGLYVLYLGLPVLMKAPKEKAVGYTVTIVVCAIVIGLVFAKIGAAFGGFGMWSHPSVSLSSSGDNRATNDRLSQMRADIDEANKKLEAAKQSGNPQDQAAAVGAAMGALLAGGAKPAEPVDQNLLKAMLPETVGGLKRTEQESEKGGVGNLKISHASATYGDQQGRSVNLTITDAGGAPMFAGLAAWASVEEDKQTSDGYEKIGKVDGRPAHETYRKQAKDGEYSVVVASRFVVEARGQQVDMDTIKQAVAAVGLDKLDAMKDVGVKP